VTPYIVAHRYLCFYVNSSSCAALNSKALVGKDHGRMREEERRSAVRCCPVVSLETLSKTKVKRTIYVPAVIRTGNSCGKSSNCLR